MKRESVLQIVQEFPQEFDLEELMEKLVFVENVEKGLKQLDEGKTVSHEKVKEIVRGWRNSNFQSPISNLETR
jgi:predicted transcriptional regulator